MTMCADIHFSQNRGSFIRPCPCSPETVGCGYYNLDLLSGCPFDCSYCILQDYLPSKEPVFYDNFGDLKTQLQEFAGTRDKIRLGSGELCDSLAFEHLSDYSLRIVSIFRDFSEIVFEFKTKSDLVFKVAALKETCRNIIFSWSLNPPEIISREEHGTASLAQRLQAMRTMAALGYRIGIHFDPIILCGDWRQHYDELLQTIAATVKASQIGWWSLGALRFHPGLRPAIFRHHGSRLFEGELIPGYDGKYRYYSPLRLEAFAFMKRRIRELFSREVPLYLCMESNDIWNEIFPETEPCKEKINALLYEGFFR